MQSKPEPKRKAQDRGVATRQKIIEEALQQFSRHGFDGVGVREIAESVGVQHGLIKYHFGSKDELWRDAVRLLFTRMGDVLRPDPHEADLPPHKAFEISLRRYVRYCAEHPEHARLMVQESFRDNERLAWASESFIRPSHHRIFARWNTLMEEGMMPRVDPTLMVYAITGAAQSIFNLAAEAKLTHGIDALSNETIEAYSDAIVALFMPGLKVAETVDQK